ncbi:hypothetical protein VPH35_068035 [Triticum aestivum]
MGAALSSYATVVDAASCMTKSYEQQRRFNAPDAVIDMPGSVLLAIVALAVVSACMAFALARHNQPSMRAALPPSSYAPVVHAASRATDNDAQQRRPADDDHWSGLPDDLLFTIMSSLDIPSLRRAGAVCRSWRAAHNAFCLPALERAPCLFYACEEYGPNDAALYCPATGATFRVPFPGPPHERRGFTFACHGGWLFTTDEAGDPYLLNPVTGAQATLPPVKTIYQNDEFYDDGGKHVWSADPENGIMKPSISWARHLVFLRVAISTTADVTECTVLIVHNPKWRLSFARPGDDRWTLVSQDGGYIDNVLYNDKDGLFYILYANGSIGTLNLCEPSPSVTMIMRSVLPSLGYHTMYPVIGPSGELLQVWRDWSHIDTLLKYRGTYQDIVNKMHKDCVDLAHKDDDDNKLQDELETEDSDEEGELCEADANDQEIDASQLLREGIDLPHRLVEEVTTNELLVFKVDVDRQKLVELRDIGDHALFVGLNSVVCLPTKDFPAFEPNCIYLTDDCSYYSPMLRKDHGIWDIKNRSMRKLSDAWPNLYPWLHLPAPIWITPRF